MPGRRARAVIPMLVASALAGFAAGCSGYHFVRSNEPLGSVRRVAVQTLANSSFEPGLDLLVTDALRRELRRHGLVLVADPAQADLVLAGTVLDLHTTTRSFSSIAFSLEYQVQITVQLVATLADGKTLAIDPTALSDWELYLTSSDVQAERRNRDEALRRLAAVLASRVQESLAQRLVEP